MSSNSCALPSSLFGPCDKYVTTSNLLILYLFKTKTECDSFSENIATRMFIGFTTPLPEDCM